MNALQGWTDNKGDPEEAISVDHMLDDITLYWFTNTATSSARLSYESFRKDFVRMPLGPDLKGLCAERIEFCATSFAKVTNDIERAIFDCVNFSKCLGWLGITIDNLSD